MSRKIAIPIALVALIIAAYLIYAASATPSTVSIRASTTTSLYQTGLLDHLANEFRKTHPNVEIHFQAVGSGQALKLAEQGDVYMVFVHAPSLEKQYIEEGVVEKVAIFAYNYFVIVGPADDPAGVARTSSATDAFKKIYEAGERGLAKFVSRGDNSGTHVKELSLWDKAGLSPQGKPWYIESGQGMAQTLVMAEEMSTYTLSDISTFLDVKQKGQIPSLKILYEGGEELINIYSVYVVKDGGAAKEFANFIVSEEGQAVIAEYGKDRFGKPLFNPAKGNEAYLAEMWSKLAES